MQQIDSAIKTRKLLVKSIIVYGVIVSLAGIGILTIKYPSDLRAQLVKADKGNLYLKISSSDMIKLQKVNRIYLVERSGKKTPFTITGTTADEKAGYNLVVSHFGQQENYKIPDKCCIPFETDKQSLFKMMFLTN